MAVTLNASTSTGLVQSADTSGEIQLQSNGTTELTVTSTGVTVADNLLFNSGYGSAATAYGCRAWVNFNGTGTVAIRGSANVSSITDNGTGQYTINMTTAMPDKNYSATMGAEITFSGSTFYGNGLADFANWTTSACKVRFLITGGGNWDPELCCIAIHR